MLTKIVAFAIIAIVSNAVKQYVATFSTTNSGVSGTVTVDNGKITIALDLTDLNDTNLPENFTTCTTGGLAYHIHEKWEPTSNNDLVGETECGGGNTGSHIDQWNACGASSGSEFCEDITNPSPTKCIPKGGNNYVPNYPTNFTSAEIGDWSGKYGKIILTSQKTLTTTESSFWEVTSDELYGLSVVFHCNSGKRAFCAPFLESNTDATETIPAQSNGEGKTVSALFSDLTSDSIIILYANGNVSINIDATNTYESESMNGCLEFEYGIFEKTSGNTCETMIGAQYDPTNQCLPWTQSDYCSDGKICNSTNGEYDCDFENDRYSCAPADLSGKFGLLANPKENVLTVDSENKGSLIPITDDLIGKMIAITCPKQNGDTEPNVLTCAEIVEGVTGDDSSAGGLKVLMVFVLSVGVVLY